MANSKYEYVKSFELEDEQLPNLILVRIDGRDFSRFSQVHEFEKPNDEAALNLLNSCSAAVLEEFPDIIFAYGYSDEYRFQSSLCLTLFVLGFYTLTHSLLFSLSSVALCSRKHQDSTRDEPGLDSSKT
ncbi:hypothetical protein YC2023_065053 [Brassica napus]